MIRSRRSALVPMVPLPPRVLHETTTPLTGDLSGDEETVWAIVQGGPQVPFESGGLARVLPITTKPDAADGRSAAASKAIKKSPAVLIFTVMGPLSWAPSPFATLR